MHVEVTVHHRNERSECDDAILTLLGDIKRKLDTMSDATDKLTAEVDAVIATMTAATDDIATIKTELSDALANGDDTAIQAAIDKLEPVRAALATASAPDAPVVAAAAAVATDPAPTTDTTAQN